MAAPCQSRRTVSCLFMSNASLSLVPTPSVPATRYESPAAGGQPASKLGAGDQSSGQQHWQLSPAMQAAPLQT